MPRLFVTDSANTSRKVQRLIVIDSANVARSLKRLFVVDASNLARLVYQSDFTDTFSITAGHLTGPPAQTGYVSGSIGSITGGTLTGGKVIAALQETGSTAQLVVSGFTSDPGSGWLASITANGVTEPGNTAAYSYLSGDAQWDWGALWGFVNGNTYNGCQIVHS